MDLSSGNTGDKREEGGKATEEFTYSQLLIQLLVLCPDSLHLCPRSSTRGILGTQDRARPTIEWWKMKTLRAHPGNESKKGS